MGKSHRLINAKRVAVLPVWLIVIILGAGLVFGKGGTVSANPVQVKELNFVLLHGMNSTSASTQLLADTIEERAQAYISAYEQANPGVVLRINTLQRSYPNTVGIATWANNIGDAVQKHFAGKKGLILIGHSMGGKAALYAVAANVKNLGNLTAMVVTINSPMKKLDDYYVTGGGSVVNYIQASRIISDKGVAESVGTYDSSADGLQVSTSKHWLAFVSGEDAPLSPQFDFTGVDPFPKDMDDGLVPVSAQYATGADAVYYGECEHSDFTANPETAGIIADQLLRYLFGGRIETGDFAFSSNFEHHAGWTPFIYRWNDRLGEFPGTGGVIAHTNNSFFKWQEWEDIVTGCSPGYVLASYQIQLKSFPFLTRVTEVRWLNPVDPTDCRLYVKSKVAPKNTVRAQWKIFQYQLLPPGVNRDHYEIRVIGGTSLAGITQASWLTVDKADTRLRVRSQAEGPFRWYKAEIKIYKQQAVQRKVIDGIPSMAVSELAIEPP